MENTITKNVVEFVTVATEYCAFLEKHDQYSNTDFMKKLHKMLSLIYLKASLSEDSSLDNNTGDESEIFVAEYDYIRIKNIAAAKLGKYDGYLNVFKNTFNSDQDEQAELSECVADIWQDLKNLTENFRNGTPESRIVAFAQCINNFKEYWGMRDLALAASLHSIIYGEDFSDSEDDDNADLSDENSTGGYYDNFLNSYHKDI